MSNYLRYAMILMLSLILCLLFNNNSYASESMVFSIPVSQVDISGEEHRYYLIDQESNKYILPGFVLTGIENKTIGISVNDIGETMYLLGNGEVEYKILIFTVGNKSEMSGSIVIKNDNGNKVESCIFEYNVNESEQSESESQGSIKDVPKTGDTKPIDVLIIINMCTVLIILTIIVLLIVNKRKDMFKSQDDL